MINLAELKKIRVDDTHLIFGYFREACVKHLPQNEPYYHIVSNALIVSTCLAFYYIKHEWDTTYMSQDCIVNGNFVEKKIESRNAESTILLKNEIYKPCIHTYKFKIIHYGETWTNEQYDCTFDISIGIIDSKLCRSSAQRERKDTITDELIGCQDRDSPAYCYTTSIAERISNRRSDEYGIKCKANDIITMIVDLNNYNIRYKVNDQHLGIAFDEIEEADYRVALTLQGKGSKVELIN